MIKWIGQNWGNLASVIGLIWSAFLTYKVIKLNEVYSRIARMPELIARLTEYNSSINGCLNEFHKSKNDVRTILPKVSGILRNLEKKLDHKDKIRILELVQMIDEYNVDTKGRDGLWEIYHKSAELVETVRDFREDLLWKNR